MKKISISTGHPDAGRIYAEAYDAALARESALRDEIERQKNHFKAQLQGAKYADDLQQRLTVAEQQLGIQDRFAGYLLDHCEGEVIYEESLQYWLSESIKLHAESLKPAETDPIQKIIDGNPLAENAAAQALLDRPKRWSKPAEEGEGS